MLHRPFTKSALWVCAVLALPALAAAQPAASKAGEALLAKASSSFSSTPFDTRYDKARESLRLVDSCGSNNECEYYNADGVRLTFVDSQQVLVMKTLKMDRAKGKSVKALGIGIARGEQQVLRNVGKFLPGAKLICHSAAVAGEGDGISTCGAVLGAGRIKMLFDKNHQLLEARVHSTQN